MCDNQGCIITAFEGINSVKRHNSTPIARRHRISRVFCAAAIALIAIAFALPASADTGKPVPPALTAPPASGRVDYLPALHLTDQYGKPVSLSSFKGKPVLIGFIHTSCKGVCELMTAKMKQVAQTLGAQFNSSVAMVSITTDPAKDNPAQLLKYAKAQGVDAEGFTFLTGKTGQIERLLALFDVPEDGPDEATTHVLDLFLISPDGAGIRKYNGMSVSSQALASAIRSSDSRH
jgi:cytochrome oxidase Cu insertion factor (SCO1/SenC/PrrC family)